MLSVNICLRKRALGRHITTMACLCVSMCLRESVYPMVYAGDMLNLVLRNIADIINAIWCPPFVKFNLIINIRSSYTHLNVQKISFILQSIMLLLYGSGQIKSVFRDWFLSATRSLVNFKKTLFNIFHAFFNNLWNRLVWPECKGAHVVAVLCLSKCTTRSHDEWFPGSCIRTVNKNISSSWIDSSEMWCYSLLSAKED